MPLLILRRHPEECWRTCHLSELQRRPRGAFPGPMRELPRQLQTFRHFCWLLPCSSAGPKMRTPTWRRGSSCISRAFASPVDYAHGPSSELRWSFTLSSRLNRSRCSGLSPPILPVVYLLQTCSSSRAPRLLHGSWGSTNGVDTHQYPRTRSKPPAALNYGLRSLTCAGTLPHSEPSLAHP